MFSKRHSIARVTEMGCCGCFRFAFARKPKRFLRPTMVSRNHISREFLLNEELEYEDDDCSYNGDVTDTGNGDDGEFRSPAKRSEEILMYRTQHGLICREFPVKETHKLIRSEDDNGNKMVNEYVREWKIGSGSYAKVVLYRSRVDGNHYAIKAFHKSHLLKLRVAPSETAMTDVLREVLIMKMLEHPNIVNLIEVIDDPTADHFYMVLEYVEGKWVCEGSGPPGGLGENTARKYLRDIVSGLMYLHAHNIVHGDIKPDNLLVTGTGTVKIGDFSVSQVFELRLLAPFSKDKWALDGKWVSIDPEIGYPVPLLLRWVWGCFHPGRSGHGEQCTLNLGTGLLRTNLYHLEPAPTPFKLEFFRSSVFGSNWLPFCRERGNTTSMEQG